MNFDFYDTYLTFSNSELMMIIRQPDQYQEEAVLVARQILATREISDIDTTLLESRLQEIEEAKFPRRISNENIRLYSSDFLESIIHPSSEFKGDNWIKVMLLILGVQFMILLFSVAKELYEYLRCFRCSWNPYSLTGYLVLIFLPVLAFLIYNRRKWGWIFLFADSFIVIIYLIVGFANAYMRSHLYNNWVYDFSRLLFRVAMCVFLWKAQVASLFSVSQKVKNQTFVGSIVFTLISYLLTEMHLK